MAKHPPIAEPRRPRAPAPSGARRGFVVLVVLICLSAAIGAGGWVGFHQLLVPALDTELDKLRDYQPPVVSHITDRDDTVIDTLYDERRVWVPLWSISIHMQNAVLAAEDRRFFEHPGFDWLGIMRAAWANTEAMTYRQGASTLTQQLVKHLLVGHQKTLDRKLTEVLLAWRLEQRWSKRQLLELYLNYIYLGEGNYGVEAAAQDYFGKPAEQLNIAESALLAGLIPSPSNTSPRKYPREAIEGRNRVLDAMVAAGYAGEHEVASLRYGEMIPEPRPPHRDDLGSAYRTEVRRQLAALLPPEQLFEHGMRIETAYDAEVQAVAEVAVNDAALAVQERQGHAGPVHVLGYDDWELFFVKAPGVKRNTLNGDPLPPQPGECLPAGFHHHYDKLIYAGPFALRLSPEARATLIRAREPDEPPKPLSRSAKAGEVYRVCINAKGEADLQGRDWVQGAAVVMENQTGHVLAVVGGTHSRLGDFNRATQARRQPGSAFKPVVYAAALDSGKNQLSRVLDGPVSLGGRGARWRPGNYDHHYRGWVTLRAALSQSLNTATVRVALAAGMPAVAAMGRRLGLGGLPETDPTLALGTAELSPLELTAAFSTFARGGIFIEPSFITRVTDRQGAEIGLPGSPIHKANVHTAPLPGARGQRALSEQDAYTLVDMLREVVRSGTGRAAHRRGYDRAGKTGTTSDYADAWFVGMTPTYTIGVWLGCDERSPLGQGEAGGKAALPAWMAIAQALEDRELQTQNQR